MHEEEKVYRELQEHLDRQAVCYPATKSGTENSQKKTDQYVTIILTI